MDLNKLWGDSNNLFGVDRWSLLEGLLGGIFGLDVDVPARLGLLPFSLKLRLVFLVQVFYVIVSSLLAVCLWRFLLNRLLLGLFSHMILQIPSLSVVKGHLVSNVRVCCCWHGGFIISDQLWRAWLVVKLNFWGFSILLFGLEVFELGVEVFNELVDHVVEGFLLSNVFFVVVRINVLEVFNVVDVTNFAKTKVRFWIRNRPSQNRLINRSLSFHIVFVLLIKLFHILSLLILLYGRLKFGHPPGGIMPVEVNIYIPHMLIPKLSRLSF